jgi:hypothetical protein
MHDRPTPDGEPSAKHMRTLSITGLLSLPDDCLGAIISFLNTRAWIQFSYTCKEINAFKYAQHLMIHKKRTIWVMSADKGMLLESLAKSTDTLFNVHFGMCYDPVAVLGPDDSIDDRFFAPLAGTIHTLSIRWCPFVTDAAFVHLKGIHTLDMSHCNQETITDAAFKHLKGIHTLNMSHCTQHTITNKAFEHLKGIHTLDISGCKRVTDAAFEHLRGIHTLDMAGCRQITDRAFEHLKGIHTLSVGACTQLTDAAMAHISGVRNLAVWGCTRLTDEAFRHLAGVEVLNMNRCSDTLITPAVLGYLRGARYISAARCDQFREYDRLLRLLDTRTKMFLVPYLEDSTKNVASEITQQPPQ